MIDAMYSVLPLTKNPPICLSLEQRYLNMSLNRKVKVKCLS